MAKKINFEKLKKFYYSNRIYCILMIISILCILILGIGVIAYFIGQATSSSYGTRLEEVENHPVEKELIEYEKYFKESEGVKSVTIRLQGKIIYTTVEVEDNKTNEDIQNLATGSLEKLSDDEKNFYDVQYIFKRKSYNPYLGSKSHSKTIISWANYKFEEETTTTETTKKKK